LPELAVTGILPVSVLDLGNTVVFLTVENFPSVLNVSEGEAVLESEEGGSPISIRVPAVRIDEITFSFNSPSWAYEANQAAVHLEVNGERVVHGSALQLNFYSVCLENSCARRSLCRV
jgi:hypothetical protein